VGRKTPLFFQGRREKEGEDEEEESEIEENRGEEEGGEIRRNEPLGAEGVVKGRGNEFPFLDDEVTGSEGEDAEGRPFGNSLGRRFWKHQGESPRRGDGAGCDSPFPQRQGSPAKEKKIQEKG